jgi:hypothetical protein
MPTFYIRHGMNGTDRGAWDYVSDSDGNPLEYLDGKSAATALEALRDHFSREYWRVPHEHSICIYREADAGEGDALWQEREASRFASGRYKPLPWEADPELLGNPKHFAHIAESDERKVAFTESEEKGRADKQKVMNVRDYLDLHIIGHEDRKRFYASVMLGLSQEVHFAETSDDIEAVYLEIADYNRDGGDYAGVLSCMTYHGKASPRYDQCDRGARKYWDVHPVRVYGAGDLALAYMRKTDAPGVNGEASPIVARALVWPSKGICGRVYGPGAGVLRGALRAKGYGRFADEALEGARLLAIPHPNGAEDYYVIPYIDGYKRFKWDCKREYFLIASGGFRGDTIDGGAYAHPVSICERCEEDGPRHNFLTVDDELWCQSCAYNASTQCEHCNNWTTQECNEVIVSHYTSTIGRIRTTGEYWCSDCCENGASYSEAREVYIDNEQGETCDDCEEFFLSEELRDEDAERVCERCHCDRHPEGEDAPEAPALPFPPAQLAPIASRAEPIEATQYNEGMPY